MNKSLNETINKMLKEIEEKNFEYFDREKAILQLVLQHNEIERLNNIINELEKFLDERSEFTNFGFLLDYLKELKER